MSPSIAWQAARMENVRLLVGQLGIRSPNRETSFLV